MMPGTSVSKIRSALSKTILNMKYVSKCLTENIYQYMQIKFITENGKNVAISSSNSFFTTDIFVRSSHVKIHSDTKHNA